MADWPDKDALKQTLDVDTDDFDDRFENVIASAIAQVKNDVGAWEEGVDEPTESLAEAALLLAVRVARAPGEAVETVTWAARRQDFNYNRLLKGHRRRFGLA